MNTDTKNNEIPEKALELLPWFVTGKLSPEEYTYFTEELKNNSALESMVEEERNVFNLVTEDKSLIGLSTLAPPESRLENIFKQIDNLPADTPTASNTNLIDKFKNIISSWIPTSFSTTEYARFASVSLLVVSLAALMAFVAPLFTEKSEFTPATAKTANIINEQLTTVLLIGTSGSIDSLQSHPLLKGKLKKVESVPDKEGIYQISFNKKLSKTEVKDILSSLSANKELIWFAGEAY